MLQELALRECHPGHEVPFLTVACSQGAQLLVKWPGARPAWWAAAELATVNAFPPCVSPESLNLSATSRVALL